MNPIKALFKFLWNDVKTDYLALKEIGQIVRREKELSEDKRIKFRKVFLEGWGDWFKRFIKTGWIGLLILILAFFVGWHYSAIYYQNVCNEYIYETYIEPNQIGKDMFNYDLNEDIILGNDLDFPLDSGGT